LRKDLAMAVTFQLPLEPALQNSPNNNRPTRYQVRHT
jgi:hypothetical protein